MRSLTAGLFITTVGAVRKCNSSNTVADFFSGKCVCSDTSDNNRYFLTYFEVNLAGNNLQVTKERPMIEEQSGITSGCYTKTITLNDDTCKNDDIFASFNKNVDFLTNEKYHFVPGGVQQCYTLTTPGYGFILTPTTGFEACSANGELAASSVFVTGYCTCASGYTYSTVYLRCTSFAAPAFTAGVFALLAAFILLAGN